VKRILVGVDGSDEAAAAVDKAAELARAVGADVTLAYVVPRHPPPGPDAYAPEEEVREEKLEHSYAPAMLRQMEQRCSASGVPVDSATLTGPIAASLADLAESGGFDLVVVGHRGRGGVRRALLGSVADRLVQISPRPVLVVR
jgi:nucleotide-binding universal stress UspA family protein